MWCVGNGQKNQWQLQKKVGALNCMHDQQIILKGGDELNDVSEDEMIVRRLTPL